MLCINESVTMGLISSSRWVSMTAGAEDVDERRWCDGRNTVVVLSCPVVKENLVLV